MKVLLKNATIIDPASPHHLSRQDVLITNGIFEEIQPGITSNADTTIELPGLHISPGWFDPFANFCDPGYEFKESLESGALAAAAGGFTRVMVVPNTKPVIDNKSQVEYIIQKSRLLPVHIIPIGAITKNTEGKELAEMYDMQQSGAVSFSDGLNPVQSAGMMVKALQYVKRFNGVIIQLPDDRSLAPQGLMNEGVVSTRLGLPGKPLIAEELFVTRDIALASYTGSRIHFTGISSPKSLHCIREAKNNGLSVSCSVTPYHLLFCDEDLMEYDTNLKVNPPLGTRSQMMALRQAVQEGLVDCIATHHAPQDTDSKVVEFENAKNGMISLETCYSMLKMAVPAMSEEGWIKLLCVNPLTIFGFDRQEISRGSAVDITVFQPSTRFAYDQKIKHSRSGNSPLFGRELTGKITGIIRGSQVHLN